MNPFDLIHNEALTLLSNVGSLVLVAFSVYVLRLVAHCARKD